MKTQLRIYEVEAGRIGEVVDFFERMTAVRRRFGFTIDFAAVDEVNSRFVWALSHDDWDRAQAEYEGSPDRARLFEGKSMPILDRTITMVERLEPPTTRACRSGP